MNNKKIIILSVVFSFVFLCIISTIFFGIIFQKKGTEPKIQANNTTNIECITKKYSKKEINNLILLMQKEHMCYEQIKQQFVIECIRETYQGYYIILMREDNAKLFVFFDGQLMVNNYCIIDDILSEKDFEFVELNVTSKEQIIQFDNNTIVISPFSADTSSKHIVKEGVLVVNYKPNNLVSDVHLITHEQLSNENSNYNNDFIPYILCKDISNNKTGDGGLS